MAVTAAVIGEGDDVIENYKIKFETDKTDSRTLLRSLPSYY